MSSPDKVYVWVKSSDFLQYFPNIPREAEPQTVEYVRYNFSEDICCIMSRMDDFVDLSKFKPRFIRGYLFIVCSDVRTLTENGIIPECMFDPDIKQPEPVQQRYLAVKVPSPYIRVPNPYDNPYYSTYNQSSSYSVVKSSYDEEIRKQEELKRQAELMEQEELKRQEEIRKREESIELERMKILEEMEKQEKINRREAICMQLKSICEDESSILYGLIHMAYESCINHYGPDAIHKAPGVIYSDIITNIIKCGKFMNQEIENISAIFDAIGELNETQKLITDCQGLIIMWDEIGFILYV